MICSICDDRDEAYRRARIHVGTYAAWTGFDYIIAHEGLQDDQLALRQALMAQGMAALETATSDRLVERLSITGTPAEALEKARAFEGVVPHLLLHPPSIPPLREESNEAFAAILDTFGRTSVDAGRLAATA